MKLHASPVESRGERCKEDDVRRILETGGASLGDLVKVTVFVTDICNREAYGEVR